MMDYYWLLLLCSLILNCWTRVHTKPIALFSLPSTFLRQLNKRINLFYVNPVLETTARLLFCFVSWHFIKHCFSPFNIIMTTCAVNCLISTTLMINPIERVVEISRRETKLSSKRDSFLVYNIHNWESAYSRCVGVKWEADGVYFCPKRCKGPSGWWVWA